MSKAIIPYVPDNGEVPPIVRKAINVIRSILNPLLIRDELIRVQEDNPWHINVAGTADAVLAVELFGHKPQLPGLSEMTTVFAQDVIMNQVFTPRVSYGQVG